MQTFTEVVLWLRNHSVLPMMAVFLIIAAATYWPGRRRTVETHAMIPFRDDV